MPSPDLASRTFTENARRAQIITAAITTVNEIGYHRASLSEIAVRAGVAKSAIVYYFGARDRLLLSVVDQVFTDLGQEVAQVILAETNPVTQLKAYLRAYLNYVGSHRAEVTAGIEIVVAHRTEDGTPLYLTGTEEDSRIIRDILAGGMDAGVFRQMPLSVAVSIVEAVLDVGVTEVQRDRSVDLTPFVDETVAFVLQGLRVERRDT
ncbi:TetR/AcrR family transcriptional regulator [Leucobacter sp. wl10]|uniref:TetR/AcrR family transcriptional regulator n=1 Tax=Leucobacter sp. wl10 TaxID=2304677 RepID=UPI0013C360AC|nr:TetR/AcrR family transcriptional regulator [Leucobacter sp. wl10]